MAKEPDQNEPEVLEEDELERQQGEPLPDREVMTILPIEPTAPGKWVPVPPLEPLE